MHSSEIKSPFTGGPVREEIKEEEVSFRGEKFTVHARYYVCEDTGEQFTQTEQDNCTFNDLYAQYRVKHGIPFPGEIKAIRERYNLNYAQIGKILGFGVNQWAKYENGQLPTESNGRLIAALRKKSTTLALLDDIQDIFEPDEFAKIKGLILNSPDIDPAPSKDSVFYRGTARNIENGYGEFCAQKVEEMVKFFCGEGSYPTKINKQMFYADFIHYKKFGISISGLRYQAIHYGPVPVHYDTIYDNIIGLEKESIIKPSGEVTLLRAADKANLGVFNATERQVIEQVQEKLAPLSTAEIIELSHKEEGWISAYPQKAIIPYSEAYSIEL